jgi:hypothetical protein
MKLLLGGLIDAKLSPPEVDALLQFGARDGVQEKRRSEWRPVADQLCFSFDVGEPRAVSGVEIWRERRRAELGRFAAETGLPIGHLVRHTFQRAVFRR